MNVKPMLGLLTALILGCFSFSMAQEQTGKERQYAPPPTPSVPANAAAAGVSINDGYVTPLGAFDLPGRVVLYVDEGGNFRNAKVKPYHEDANFVYFAETNSPTFFWAFAKSTSNGGYRVWWQPGNDKMEPYSVATRLPRVGDTCP